MSDPNLGFKLDPKQTAIVVIDLQKGIAAYPGAPVPMATVVANTARLLAAAREAGAQPVLVRVSLYPDAADRLNPPADQQGRMPGSLPPEWSELLPELDCKPGEIVITKRQWGGFYGTDLELQLRRRGLATIVLCGVATEFGVESTARDAYERGFHLVFAADAMTGTHPDSHSNSIDRIFPRIGRVRSTDEIIAALQP